jgi:alkanesulfonate monooxygenase SsuD/methylene tetrahydromethanopterin reductase-like flavin-dependent oxidoreductase (luciferase family)
MNARPAGLPDREAGSQYQAAGTRDPQRRQRREEPGEVMEQARAASFRVIAGTPETMRNYMDEYVSTGANYFVGAFHFGNMPAHIAERSIELFITDVMPHYV